MAEEIKHNDELAKEEATPAQSGNEDVLSFNDLFSDDSNSIEISTAALVCTC